MPRGMTAFSGTPPRENACLSKQKKAQCVHGITADALGPQIKYQGVCRHKGQNYPTCQNSSRNTVFVKTVFVNFHFPTPAFFDKFLHKYNEAKVYSYEEKLLL